MKTSPVRSEKVSKEQLLALAEKVPGAWIGIKITRGARAVNKAGVEALVPKKQTGRPPRMTPKIVAQIERHLEESPQRFGLNRVRWDGPTLAAHIQRQFGIKLKVRQAQYWMHQFGYRLKRASHAYLQAKAEDAKKLARSLKKTQNAGD